MTISFRRAIVMVRGPEWFARDVNMAANQAIREYQDAQERLAKQAAA